MRKDIVIAVVAVVAVSAVAFGLSTMSRDLPLTPSAPLQAEKTSGEKKLAAGDKIVMHVNGEPVTEREFGAFLAAAPQQARALVSSPAGRRAIAGELVKVKVLEQEARRRGLDKDPEVQTQAAFMRAQIEAGRALEKIIEERAEQTIRAQYATQKNNWFVLRHIAVAYQGSQIPPRNQNAAPTLQQAMAKAQEIVKRLRAGADFTRTAVAESDDVQSARQGGVLGPVTPDRLGDLGPAVAKVPMGQVSDPVQSPLAVHIFKKEEASLDDLRPALTEEVRQQVVQEEIARLQKNAKVDLDPKFFPEPPKRPAANPMQ